MTKDTQKKPAIDWIAVEVAYRANILSLKAIGAEYSVSDAGILKRAKRDGWTRDLAAKIRQRAAAKVSARAVSAEVSALTKATETQVIEANAQLQSEIILSHRTDIQRARRLTMNLLSELEHQTDNLDLYEKLAELLFAPDDKGVDKRNELFNKVISLSGRSTTMKTLADSLKSLIALEREAFGVDQKESGSEGGVEKLLKLVAIADGE
jgi:hypothetical protein